MATANAGPVRDTAQSKAVRLRLLGTEADGSTGPAALLLATQQAMAGLGGLGGFIHLRGAAPGELRLAAVSGLVPGFSTAWARVHEVEEVPPARAARSGTGVWSADGMGTGASGTASVPLPAPDGPIGVLSVLTTGTGSPTTEDWSFLATVAAWAARRAEPGSEESDRQPREGDDTGDGAAAELRMSELTVALAEAVGSLDVVRAVQERVLPPFGADGMLVEIIERDHLHILGSTGYSQEFLDRIEGVPLTTHTAATMVLRTRTPCFAESPAEFLRLFPPLESLVNVSGKRAWAVLPLIASGRGIGCCVISFSEERSFSDGQRTLLTALSGLVAQALERARLYDAEHTRAQELQRGLLPRTLPSPPAVSACARYLPAGQNGEVGGDWYDVIPLSSDRVALVVGDVMGHGVTEAVTMARLRTAVRTLADLDIPPDELFAHLGDLVRDLGDDSYATCLYAEYDPVTRICRFSTAGHPPPIVVHPDGTVVRPEPDIDPPLGAAEPPFGTYELHLPDNSLLVFCTDGLVESSTRDIGEGLDQLERVVSRAVAENDRFPVADRNGEPALALDELCDTVLSDLLPDREHTDDDAVLLVVRTRGTPDGDVASFELPDDPRGPRPAPARGRGPQARLGGWVQDNTPPR
ncbi:PP2C family protein-serine/threonine phosphatase, partial [Streptomyces sp. NPDC056503]|uniref:PP2C family protein-serine/threonine phosphatase n=1 Tax=Streptomyces sp. NPDC056503 TaxID=3345842 RepID=UPI0036A20D22